MSIYLRKLINDEEEPFGKDSVFDDVTKFELNNNSNNSI